MKKHSAGIIAYRQNQGQLEVLIAHMGSPWWAKKDKGAWSIPKGEVQEGEEPLATAKREFAEELGLSLPEGELIELGQIEQKNKTVTAWAVEADIDTSTIKSNTFETEWPPRSGKMQKFPEIDRAEYMTAAQASPRLVAGQAEFLQRLGEKLGMDAGLPEQPSLF